jgi:predicted DNA binding protein
MDGVLVSGTGTAEGWTFEVRSDTRDAIAGFQRYCRDHDVPITVTAVRALTDIGGETARDLTAAQREALVLAYERGYFRSPRETSLDALASELGITAQAFGGRLRRGTHRLVASTLIGSEG